MNPGSEARIGPGDSARATVLPPGLWLNQSKFLSLPHEAWAHQVHARWAA